MSEPLEGAKALIVWPRDARPPGRAPVTRHEPLPGLAAVDWQWRHGFACRREYRFLEAALAACTRCGPAVGEESGLGPDATAMMAMGPPDLLATAAPVALAETPSGLPGDLGLAQVEAAFMAACAASGQAPLLPLLRRVLALLRGCYVIMPVAERLPTIALTGAVAARCGLSVHLCCEDRETVPTLLAAVEAGLTGSGIVALALAESAADESLVSDGKAAVLCATAAALAHAWLRWGGESRALTRASAWLGGAPAPMFSYAALLLCCDGDRVLLDLMRHPLQLTSEHAEVAGAFLAELSVLLIRLEESGAWGPGGLTAAGEAVIADVAREQGGLWAVPKLRTDSLEALLIARNCVAERDYVMEGGRLRWLLAPETLATDTAPVARIETALRCLQGQGPAARVRRRAWFRDFFAGYPRVGAAGANLDNEWRDLWWLHGLPVLDNAARPLAVKWSTDTLVTLASRPGLTVIAGHARLLARPGMPATLQSLESREVAGQLAERLAQGEQVEVVGVVAACRQLPDGVSSIILAADDPVLPPALMALALRALRGGRAGRWLAALLGRVALGRAARQRYDLRRQLVLRRVQERRTYAFTGESREGS